MTDPLAFEPRERYDRAVIGLAWRAGYPILCYDYDRLMDALIEAGMELDAAAEHIQINMAGGWVGEGTPAVLTRMSLSEIEEALS